MAYEDLGKIEVLVNFLLNLFMYILIIFRESAETRSNKKLIFL